MKHESKIVLLTAVLAFFGAAGGTYITSYFNTTFWEKKTRYEESHSIYSKRIELLEKTVGLINNMEYARDLSRQLSSMPEALEIERLKIINHIESDEVDKLINKFFSDREKLIHEYSNYATIMSMNGLFFGKKTAKIIDTINKISHPLDVNTTLHKELLDAMREELFVGL